MVQKHRHSNRRQQLRRALAVDCQIVRERDFRLVGDGTLDVSPDGVRFRMLREVLTGEHVIVSFQLPDSTDWVDATGTVARVIHGRRPGDRVRAVGVRFDGLDERTRTTLTRRLRGVPPPLPGAVRL